MAASNTKRRKKYTPQQIVFIVLKYLILVFAALLVILPILPVLLGSFKSNDEFYSSGLLAFPKKWQFSNYTRAFVDGNMLLGFGNTILMLVVSITISVLLGAMVAYILNRFRFKGKKIISSAFLLATLIPTITNNIALFQILVDISVFNTRWAGILLFSGTDIISIYIFLQFMDNISKSLDESAMIDGASYLRIFIQIVFPLLLPAIATVAIIKGVAIYNDFTTPFLFMPKAELAMLSTSLYNFTGPFGAKWEIICAGVIAVTIPMLVIFLLFQKWIYNGLAVGSVKE